ncbi:site-specific integrase [Prauserella alba]|nr:site-specific integrase [Prauserella alba]
MAALRMAKPLVAAVGVGVRAVPWTEWLAAALWDVGAARSVVRLVVLLRTGWAVGEWWTVSVLLDRFLAAPALASPLTWDARVRDAAAVRADALGWVRLGLLGPWVLDAAVRRWQAAGIGAGEVRGRLAVVRAAVRWAGASGLLAGDVLAGTRGVSCGAPRAHMPVGVVGRLVALAGGDVARARDRVACRPWSRSAVLALFRAQQNLLLLRLVAETGLRRGELAGLCSDDLLGRVVWVERAVKVACGGLVVGPVKSYRPGRVSVSAATAALWREYVERWFGQRAMSGVEVVWLFATELGPQGPIHPATLGARYARMVGRLDAGAVTGLHRVRHTVATTLVGLGQFERARRRLRHRRLDTTLRHYTDTTALAGDVEVADELQAVYRNESAGVGRYD